MDASYNWLRDYCKFDLPVHELAPRMSHAGLNVDTYEPRGDDYFMDVEVKSNRPDCLSHVGLAREIAAITGASVSRPDVSVPPSGDCDLGDAASVQVTAGDLCPHYTARVIRGVKVGRSPEWLRRRLEVCGIRPVNNVVDATNYVMLECGQPLHAFDLSLIGGRSIVVRRAQPGETLTTIDGAEHELTGEECVIADSFRPVALAGVMGGLGSEINESTVDLLLESARFDPTSVRRTSRRHQVASESSYRFERGVDPETTDWASRRACELIVELAGGEVAPGCGEVRFDETATPEITLRLSRLALVLGLDVPREEVDRTFRGLELDVVGEDEDAITVRVPSWRRDLQQEVDLIEEVARIYGYDKIGETTQMPVRSVVPTVRDLAAREGRRTMAGQGFHEVMCYSLIAPTPLQLAQPWHAGEPIGVRNPVNVERTHLRLTNMANLLGVKRLNQSHGLARVDLFELGYVYVPAAAGELPTEKRCLSALTDRDDGVRTLKGVLSNLLHAFGIETSVEEAAGGRGPFADGESVTLRLDGELLGVAGVVSADAADTLGLQSRPAMLEVDFDLLTERCRLDSPYRAVATFPATDRDLAIVVDEQVLWAQIDACILGAAPDFLESVEFLDTYRGDPVPAGRKSIALRLTFRLPDRTITAPEAEEARTAILQALQAELQAELR